MVRGNNLDGSSLTGDPDSWVDVKGNGWLIEENSGANSTQDGFQTHEILDGWGTDNVFRNTASGAAEGLSNVDCVG